MKIIIKENRNVIGSKCAGTQNENIATTLEFEYPEQYKDYDKLIVFVTDDGVVSDVLSGGAYQIKKSVTKYGSVKCYVCFYDTETGEDFRSVEFALNFYTNHDLESELTEEETNAVQTVITTLNATITKVDNLEEEMQEFLNSAKEAEEARVIAETSRVEAEENRVSAEVTRVNAETERVLAENKREENEVIRNENENERIANEKNRQTVETARVNAESERASAEETRQANEKTRELAEASRESKINSKEGKHTYYRYYITEDIAEDTVIDLDFEYKDLVVLFCGERLIKDVDYEETSSTSITLLFSVDYIEDYNKYIDFIVKSVDEEDNDE